MFGKACALYADVLGADTRAVHRCRIYRLLDRLEHDSAADPRLVLATFRQDRDAILAALPTRHPLRAELELLTVAFERRSGLVSGTQDLEAAAIKDYREAVGTEPSPPLRGLH